MESIKSKLSLTLITPFSALQLKPELILYFQFDQTVLVLKGLKGFTFNIKKLRQQHFPWAYTPLLLYRDSIKYCYTRRDYSI